jgi:hypothetical protein
MEFKRRNKKVTKKQLGVTGSQAENGLVGVTGSQAETGLVGVTGSQAETGMVGVTKALQLLQTARLVPSTI